MDVKEILSTLTEAEGISGHENALAPKISAHFRNLCDSVEQDKLGNIIACKKGVSEDKENIKIMIAAHMDEIGLVITKIEDDGFLRFSAIGGFDPRTLPGQKVIIHGKQKFTGVIGANSPHFIPQNKREKAIKMEDLFIDAGFASAEQLKAQVNVGDTVSISRDMQQLRGDNVSGKALDDRAGVAVLYYCLHKLQSLRHEADVFAVATVQEEVGVRGASVASYNLSPHLGLAVDVCHGNVPGVSEFETAKVGGGPVIGKGPNFHPRIVNCLQEKAETLRIPVQYDISGGPTGTDARVMQIARCGIPVGLISLPLRYMHTSVELLNTKDLHLAAELMAAFISGVDRQYVEGFICC